jgi:hypothetical protein
MRVPRFSICRSLMHVMIVAYYPVDGDISVHENNQDGKK